MREANRTDMSDPSAPDRAVTADRSAGTGAAAVPSERELTEWITTRAAELQPGLVAVRRDLHAHPELGREEVRTTEVIAEQLRRLGLQPSVLRVGTGLTCDIVPDFVDPDAGLLGLRADIDALPLTETTGLPFASTNTGVAHSCGHDVHTTILLGVAQLLTELRDQGKLARGVRLIFQPAEESSPGGAIDVVGDNRMLGVDEVYALHCDPGVDVGQIGLRTGPITSAADKVTIEVHGPGGHTSRPQLSADLIGGLADLANRLPLLLSRRVDPRGTASLVWGVIEAGHANNAIPEAGSLKGTLRCLDPATWRAARTALPGLAKEVAAPWGELEVQVFLSGDIPPTVNHPAGVTRLTRAGQAVLGWEAMVDTPQSLGGEDFGVLLSHAPGAMARLGVRSVGGHDWPDLHRPDFMADEGAIEVGVHFLTAAAAL